MKLGRRAILLSAALLLAGCGNFWQAPSTTTTGSTGGTSTLSSGAFYVLNQGTSQVAAYSIASGTLTALSGSPYTLSAAPVSIAIAPNGDFLYVGTADGIYLYTIGSTGALTLANNSAVISNDLAAAMKVIATTTNTWLVEAGPNAAALYAIAVNPTTGLLNSSTEQEQSIALPAATVQQMAVSPDNTHVYVALGSSGTEEVVFAAGNADPFGGVANIPVKNSAGAAVSVAVDPSNRMLYVGETVASTGTNTGGLRAFNYSTLVEASGSPYATGGLAPYSILPTADGSYVYVANRTVSGSSTGNIAGFSFTTSGTTYTLTALSGTATAGTAPVALAEDSIGNYLLVVDFGGNPDLEAYTMSAGVLTSVLSSKTGTDPVAATAIAAAP